MAREISQDHPLRLLFRGLTERNLMGKVGLADIEIARYVSDLLTRFAYSDNLYRIRDTRGKRLEDVGEMLLESNPILSGSSQSREREIRKHIGDYTMFFTGMFPESLRRMSSSIRLDYFVDYMKAGKESYRIVSEFTQGEYKESAPFFRRLSEYFDYCVVGLNFVKADLEALKNPQYQQMKRMIM
ncbi:hypothetical protein ACFL6S_30105 [Candidatus Poribacteria bacterium]